MFELHGISILSVSRGTFQDKREVGGGVLWSFFGGMCCWPLRTPTCVDLLIFKSSLTRIIVGSFLMDNAKRGMNLLLAVKTVGFVHVSSQDNDLSVGYCYSAFEQLGPDLCGQY